jgi:sensor histidine kinase YesM
MDIRRGCSTIGSWGRYVVIRKRRLATEGRQLQNEEKPHDLYNTGETMKMNVTFKERSTYGK